MSNRTDIVVETDNAEGRVLLSASRVYDLTEDKTQDTINGEIRNTLNQLDAEKADESSLALRRSGATNTKAQIEKGTYFYLDGTLKRAIATIAQNASFTAQNCETVTDGGLNALKNESGINYCKMPDGTLIEWGAQTGASGMAISFPQPFINNSYGLSISAHYNAVTSIRCILSDSVRSTSSFSLYAYDVSTNKESTATNIPIYWTAIGRWK